MKQIRLRILDLLDKHGESYSTCKSCPICKEIIQLRKKLDRDSTVRFKHILDKGSDMTKSDMALLLDNNVQLEQIKKVVGLSSFDFYEMMFNYGFSKRKPNRRNRGRKKDLGKLDMSVEEFVDMKYQQKLPITQIAKQKGVADPTIHHWMKKHKGEIDTLVGEKQHVTAVEMETLPEIKPSEKESKTAEYERLIAALRNDLTDINNQLDEKDELIRNLQATVDKYEHVNAACEDVENELSSLQEENGRLQLENSFYQDANKELQHELLKLQDENRNLDLENNAMRQLLKLWM